MGGYKAPDRLFDCSSYIRNALGTLNIPSSLIFPNQDQLCNLAWYDGTTRCPDHLSIILAISGIYPPLDTNKSQAAYGVWFGKDSQYNVCSLLPDSVEQSGKCAEICAASIALDSLGGSAKNYEHVVILTESDYLVNGITRDIWCWMSTRPQFQDEEGYKLPNADIWHGLHDMILQIESKGTSVEFWKAEGAETGFAADLAKSVYPKPKVILPGQACYDYFVSKASKLYEVRRIAKEIHLSLPNKSTTGNKANVKYPLRRLVLTGNDTEDNLELFFGEKWNDAEKGISDLWRQARRSVLRSLMEKDEGKEKWFDGELPGPRWNVRPASEREKRAVKEHIASRDEKEKNKKG